MNNSHIKIILAIMLLLCLLDFPYGYYQFVRYVAMIGFAYFALVSNKSGHSKATFIFIALVILFQPFIKIALGRTIWNIVDVVVAIGLLTSLKSNQNQKKDN
jgi:asparagine N-glycosylation enzyme membrane subunit Stt3